MFRRVISVVGVATILCAIVGTAVAADGCIDCHASEDFFSQYPKLDRYYKDWVNSPHAKADVGCADCHGGDPSKSTVEESHNGVLHMSDPESTLHFKNQPGTCGDCHQSKRNQFIRSKHFKAMMEDRLAPTCTTCHAAMNSRPAYRVIVLNACRNCHAPDNEQGLPLIADQAEHAFQQLDIAGGFIGWAVLHFESHGWPNDSRAKVEALSKRLEKAVDRVHRFDMDETEASAVQLQTDLRQLFEDERSTREE
jgi:hypothetical protein